MGRLRSYAKRYWKRRAADQGAGLLHAEDAEEHEPPGPDAVARRAAILAAVVSRGVIEHDLPPGPDADRVVTEGLAFFDELGLGRDAEPDEAVLVHAPHGTLEDQAVVDATWRAEGVAVLAWALGHLSDLPPIDETIDLGELARVLELPWDSAADVVVVRSPHLRPAADVEKLDAQLLTAHWRVRDYSIRPRGLDFVAWVPGVEWAPLTVEGLPIADRDLAIGGMPIAEADPDRVQLASSILTERRLAVSWLRGYDPLYSEGDVNT